MKIDLINDYKSFLSYCKTERECVNYITEMAHNHGFKNFDDLKTIKAGDKFYFQKMNKIIALFIMGNQNIEGGMNILGGHIDSPRLDAKPYPLYEKDFLVYLDTHYYGGIKKYQWVTIPLAIHGVICKKDGTVVNVCIGESIDDPVFVISDILPHVSQKQMSKLASEFIPGEILDVIVGSGKYSRSESENKEAIKHNILNILKESYNIDEEDLISAELEIVPAGPARNCGFDKSLILGYGQDDRACSYTSARAIIESEPYSITQVCLCTDKEEIGSVGATGMNSYFFENVMAEVINKIENNNGELSLRRALANSNMLSSDVNSAYDPLNTDLYDKKNSSFLGGGLVLNKYTGSRGKSGGSDANPEFIAKLRKIFDEDKISYQFAELCKVDHGGGGTIAYMAARYGMNVIDAGVPVMSMHAPWELTNKFDLEQAYNAYKCFLVKMS